MGKIDDMRRLREQQFAAANDDKSAAKTAKAATTAAGADDQGKCSSCGKMKPLTNGLVANHQKGFGKACPGSRKEPA
jgi:membrane protease subunit (stomatin/prohibitin family)